MTDLEDFDKKPLVTVGMTEEELREHGGHPDQLKASGGEPGTGEQQPATPSPAPNGEAPPAVPEPQPPATPMPAEPAPPAQEPPAAAPPSLDVEVYLSGMERLRQLKPRLLFYSHDGIGDNPEKLISSVVESTKVFGDAVLHALRTEKTDEAVARRVGELVWGRYGVKLEGHELAMNISGFAAYFKKKGLV